MINDPGMGTIVVASAGADAQAQQVISQRDRTDKGVVFLWNHLRQPRDPCGGCCHASDLRHRRARRLGHGYFHLAIGATRTRSTRSRLPILPLTSTRRFASSFVRMRRWTCLRSPRKVTYFEPVAPRLARNTIIESTFQVGRRFRCTMRVDCGQLDPGAVTRPGSGEWQPRMPEQLDEEELADWRAGRNAVYQLAALTIGARLAGARA